MKEQDHWSAHKEGGSGLRSCASGGGISIPMNMLFALITGRMLRDTEVSARPVEACAATSG